MGQALAGGQALGVGQAPDECMSHGGPSACPLRRRARRARRGISAVVMVAALLAVELIIVGAVISGARDQDLTVRRLETVQAFYAAEAGVNMAMREIEQGADEDGDGTIGTISDDADDGTDPAIGGARVVVTGAWAPRSLTITSAGRSGESRRQISATVEQ